jgi:hypothetical protein
MMRECGVTDEALRAVPLSWERSVHALHASEVLLVKGGDVVGGLLVRDTVRYLVVVKWGGGWVVWRSFVGISI